MSDVVSMLPPNATDIERNIEQATARIGSVPVPIHTLRNDQTIAANLLPWLAWSRDVPFWDKSASDKNKRGIVKASLDLHRRRGTISCFRDMARWAGAELIHTITPPNKTFCAKSTTQVERNAFLDRMPQLRFFSFRNQGKKQGAMNWQDFPTGSMFPVQSTAAARLGVNAFIHADGIDTPLTTIDRSTQTEKRDAITTQEVREHSTKGNATFTGGFINWLVTSTAKARFYTLRLATPYIDRIETLHKTTIAPSMQPVDVHYDAVAENGTRAGLFSGGSFLRQFFQHTHAGDRLYKRLYLFDKAKTLEPHGMTTHLGGVRLGMLPHRAELTVRINGKQSIRAVGRFVSGFLHKGSRIPYHNMIDALRFAQRLSDRVLIDTSPLHIAIARSTFSSGNLVAGQFVRS